jgi:hypothetical protein
VLAVPAADAVLGSWPAAVLAGPAGQGDLPAARAQMGFSLACHIVVACLGVGLPALTLLAEWLGIRRNDPALKLPARPLTLAALGINARGAAFPQGQHRAVAAAAHPTVLSACLTSLACGAALLLPSLWLLYGTFQRTNTSEADRGVGR